MAYQNNYSFDFTFTDESRAQAMRVVLGYEAGRRGLSLGQTFVELVSEAADTDKYPEEVRTRLAEIREEGRKRAAERALTAAKMPMSA